MLKYEYIEEPLLEFGIDKHCCPRQGIANYYVYDTNFKVRKTQILIGAVGLSEDLEKLESWIELCKSFIAPKPDNKQPNLFPSFCGFNTSTGFKSELTFSEEIVRTINRSELKALLKIKDKYERIEKAIDLFYNHVKFLAQNKLVDVIICVIPKEFDNKIIKEEPRPLEETIDDESSFEINFRRALKAKSMHLGKPLQLIKEHSLVDNKGVQDSATRAWNFCTAIYYKANQTVPWRLEKNPRDLDTCFVGISFYRSRDKRTIQTSLAQLFDENGNGVILRGTQVEINKIDRQPHLTEEQAYNLIDQALTEYKFAQEHFPSRIVIHKSSSFTYEETSGFNAISSRLGINSIDLVSIQDGSIRLFRDGFYPALRGSLVTLNEKDFILYTKGSVEYYQTYPGLYIPTPLKISVIQNESSPLKICKEIFSLTKMNWNNTRFDGKYPITLGCARKVGEIMKYLDSHETPQIRYAFYM